jgi:hypothetical protein
MTEENKFEGLGGWLILVGIGIFVSPLYAIIQAAPLYSTMLSNGTWAALTTPGTAYYSALGASILYGEVAINIGIILAWVYVAILFFSKKKAFPKWYVGLRLFTLAFILVDALAVNFWRPDIPVFDAETTEQLMRALIVVLIWVPYILVSKRVKATFVK